MDAQRLSRYAAKLDHARTRLGQFQEWHLEDDEKSRVASYKAFQEVAEALLDVAAMALKDLGIVPTADRENLERLHREGVITKQMQERLWIANRMRNRLVHEYNGLWDAIDLVEAGEIAGALLDAVEVFAAWTASQ